jgi:hypothetical protein
MTGKIVEALFTIRDLIDFTKQVKAEHPDVEDMPIRLDIEDGVYGSEGEQYNPYVTDMYVEDTGDNVGICIALSAAKFSDLSTEVKYDVSTADVESSSP